MSTPVQQSTTDVRADAPAPETPATREEQVRDAKGMLTQMMTQIGRQGAQIDYLTRQAVSRDLDTARQFDRISDLFTFLFDHLHLTPPAIQPKLIDANIELLAELPEGERWDLRAAWSKNPHPVFGHVQAVLETEEGPKPYSEPHPIIAQRLAEAFKKLQDEGTLEEGRYYYAKTMLIHDRPLEGATPVTLEDSAAEAAANDEDGAETPELSHNEDEVK